MTERAIDETTKDGGVKLDTIICGDNAKVMATWPDACIDLVVTSPPYDDLRKYGGHSWDFPAVARELTRILKPGGVMVWVVGDATVDGSETLTSMKQAIHFREVCGLNVHDTMIWEKTGMLPTQDRYYAVVEYMMVFAKGKPKAMNFIADRPTTAGGRVQKKDAVINKGNHQSGNGYFVRNEMARRTNIWRIPIGGNATGHPAPFPLALAKDHIQTWSNQGDIVLDCFNGSGTTCKAAKELGRRFIGIEVNPEYVAICEKRVAQGVLPLVPNAGGES